MRLPRTPSFRLDGKRALVTGGTRGIGLGAAVALAEAGAEVTIAARTARDVAAAVAAMRESGFRVDGSALDVTDTAAVQAFMAERPAFDILVNSAGGARHASFLQVEERDYQAVVDLNLKATIFVSQCVATRLVAEGRSGSIINISSQMGHVSGPQRSIYSATKFAVEGLTRGMAIDLGPDNIRVNTICPTFIETEMTAGSLSDAEFRAWVLSKIKLGRLGKVEDIMGAVVFLASDASAMVTGSSLLVDGGWRAG
ncbi:SDR family oxidoreductase [Chelativorans sp.]|uniref:SDR family NAD(P)-dependent oxidoreductase n=1 Tax=Chelativorans sp. TaxID=2203393 RepID=UPI00281138E5|nr:SDR family oxidoreductase [Chelativorans sp.]